MLKRSNMKNFLRLGVALTILVTSEGCYSGRPVIVERPAPRVIVRPPQPRPGYRWVEGRHLGSHKRPIYKNGYWKGPSKKRHHY